MKTVKVLKVNLQIRSIIFLLISLVPIFATAAAKPALFYYGPANTTLDGILQTRVYPGPPNYESVKRGDLAETIWLIQLKRPVTVLDDKDPTSNNETETNVREIQLVIHSGRDQQILENYIGRPIKLTGILFHAWSGHHHLKILMDVKSYRVKK